MECDICFDIKNNIKQLPCKHELCMDCYIKLYTKKCPFCRQIFIYSTKTIKKDNYYDIISDNFIIYSISLIMQLVGFIAIAIGILSIFYLLSHILITFMLYIILDIITCVCIL